MIENDFTCVQNFCRGPTPGYFQNILDHLLALAARKPGALATMRHYVSQWGQLPEIGTLIINEFEECVQSLLPTLLPSIVSCWMPAPKVFPSDA